MCNIPSLRLISQLFLGLQSKLVLLATLKKVHCKLLKTCHTVQSPAAIYNLFKTNSLQSLQKIEPNSNLCDCCKCKKVARQVARRACYTLQPTCNFSSNAIATHVAKKIAPCSCRAQFYFLQQLQNFFRPLQVADKIAACNMSPATCNGFFSRKIVSCNTSIKPDFLSSQKRVTACWHQVISPRKSNKLTANQILSGC